jgi:hypothetical protein
MSHKEGAMANPSLYDADIKLTPKGVTVSLGKLYIYPDGHGNLTFADGKNWPFNDQYQVIEGLTLLLRKMEKSARSRTT